MTTYGSLYIVTVTRFYDLRREFMALPTLSLDLSSRDLLVTLTIVVVSTTPIASTPPHFVRGNLLPHYLIVFAESQLSSLGKPFTPAQHVSRRLCYVYLSQAITLRVGGRDDSGLYHLTKTLLLLELASLIQLVGPII